MPYVTDAALDAALSYIGTNATALHVCSQEPATYAAATATYSLGSKSGPTVGAATDGDISGRKAVVASISDGTVSATGTATHWALVGSSELLAAGALSAPVEVTADNTFTLGAFSIEFPDPA